MKEQMKGSYEPKEELKYSYKFERAAEEPEGYESVGKLVNLDIKEDEGGARLYGSLRAMFGEPDYESEDVEDMYRYRLLVTRSDGKQVIIEMYSGASGPAIASNQGDLDMKEEAALELQRRLLETSPADYDYQGYYWDYSLKIECGCKNGQIYFREEETDEEDPRFVGLTL